jgi:hypothetical protein
LDSDNTTYLDNTLYLSGPQSLGRWRAKYSQARRLLAVVFAVREGAARRIIWQTRIGAVLSGHVKRQR